MKKDSGSVRTGGIGFCGLLGVAFIVLKLIGVIGWPWVWTDGNWPSNIESITIETANSGGAPNWPVADNTLNTLIRLVADIAARNKLGKLVVGQNLTYHSQYAATACPGPYLKGKMQYIVDKANAINFPVAPVKTYTLTIGPASEGDKNTLEAMAKRLGLPVRVV